MILKKFILLLFIAFAFTACNMINPAEDLPTFIQIDSVQLKSTDPTIHGSVSHKITDVWVYFNNEILGAYQLPAKVPILTKERGQVQILAGIYEDGLSGIRAKYPFYTLDTFSINPQPAEIIKHTPVFTYRTADSLSTSYFFEDFEQGNSFEKGQGDTTFVKTNLPEDVFEGSWSNKLELSDSFNFGECVTVQEFSLPVGRMCYLELNYKSDIPFVLRTQVTVSGIKSNVDLTGINPSANWGKIYYNFGGFPNTYPTSKFKFLIDAVLPQGVSKGKILIDNFKIIHFK